jgi:hypothetical protein
MTITGRIYKIVSSQTDKVYVGSTTNLLKYRLSEHKYDYKRFQNGIGHYVTSYEIVKYEDAIIQLLEENEFENKKELHKRERYFIETIDNVVNKRIPARTKKELNKKYNDTHKEESKKYYVDNVMKLKEKFICTCGGKYTHANKSIHDKTKKHINCITININIKDVEKDVVIDINILN